jgi:hypothetical protein
MKQQLEQLKTELREFIELSKKITPGKWNQFEDCVDRGGNPRALIAIFGRHAGISREQDERDAVFIARSRNISPAMAECLLVAVEGLGELASEPSAYELQGAAYDQRDMCASVSKDTIQQILTIWEASK